MASGNRDTTSETCSFSLILGRLASWEYHVLLKTLMVVVVVVLLLLLLMLLMMLMLFGVPFSSSALVSNVLKVITIMLV